MYPASANKIDPPRANAISREPIYTCEYNPLEITRKIALFAGRSIYYKVKASAHRVTTVTEGNLSFNF